jgi:hypothetical protein
VLASGESSYYQTLDLEKGCSHEDIDASYRRLRANLLGVKPEEHDWKFNKHSDLTYEKFAKLNEAFLTLSNQCKRAFYDKGKVEEAATECEDTPPPSTEGAVKVANQKCSRMQLFEFSWTGIAGPNLESNLTTSTLVMKGNEDIGQRQDMTIMSATIEISAMYQGEIIWTAEHSLCDAAPKGLGVYCPPLKRDNLFISIPIDVAQITEHTFHEVELSVVGKISLPSPGPRGVEESAVSCLLFKYKPPVTQISMPGQDMAIRFSILAILVASVYILSKRKEDERKKVEQHYRENAGKMELKRLKVRQQQGLEQVDSGYGGASTASYSCPCLHPFSFSIGLETKHKKQARQIAVEARIAAAWKQAKGVPIDDLYSPEIEQEQQRKAAAEVEAEEKARQQALDDKLAAERAKPYRGMDLSSMEDQAAMRAEEDAAAAEEVAANRSRAEEVLQQKSTEERTKPYRQIDLSGLQNQACGSSKTDSKKKTPAPSCSGAAAGVGWMRMSLVDMTSSCTPSLAAVGTTEAAPPSAAAASSSASAALRTTISARGARVSVAKNLTEEEEQALEQSLVRLCDLLQRELQRDPVLASAALGVNDITSSASSPRISTLGWKKGGSFASTRSGTVRQLQQRVARSLGRLHQLRLPSTRTPAATDIGTATLCSWKGVQQIQRLVEDAVDLRRASNSRQTRLQIGPRKPDVEGGGSTVCSGAVVAHVFRRLSSYRTNCASGTDSSSGGTSDCPWQLSISQMLAGHPMRNLDRAMAGNSEIRVSVAAFLAHGLSEELAIAAVDALEHGDGADGSSVLDRLDDLSATSSATSRDGGAATGSSEGASARPLWQPPPSAAEVQADERRVLIAQQDADYWQAVQEEQQSQREMKQQERQRQQQASEDATEEEQRQVREEQHKQQQEQERAKRRKQLRESLPPAPGPADSAELAFRYKGHVR